MTERDDDWAATFASYDRRYSLTLGIAAVLIMALCTMTIIAYFGGPAAVPW